MRRAVVLIYAVLLLLSAGCVGRPEGKEELFEEGLRVLNANNPGGAVVSFKRALEIDHNFFEARLQLARAYRDMGKLDSAENELQKVVRQSPAFREGHIELGKVCLLKDRPDDAIREAREVLAKDENNAAAHDVLGSAYIAKGMHDEGMREIDRAIEIDPAIARLHPGFRPGQGAAGQAKGRRVG